VDLLLRLLLLDRLLLEYLVVPVDLVDQANLVLPEGLEVLVVRSIHLLRLDQLDLVDL
jgi:hypothetical protein